MKKTAYTYASREEIDVELICHEGNVPDDLSGYVYINSPCGTVNYTTPIPRKNPDGSHNSEFGQPIFNGDGIVYRFDCDTPNQIKVKTGLLRTPCYYADYHSRMGTEYHKKGFYFASKGIARTSVPLGTRNQLNTSLNSFRFSKEHSPRLTANFDAGRPFELDPVTLKLITPIGYNYEWRAELPKILHETFELVQSTAHPSFDSNTLEYFTVCFLKSAANVAFSEYFGEKFLQAKEFIIEKFKDFAQLVVEVLSIPEGKFLLIIEDFIGYIKKQHRNKNLPNYSKQRAEAILHKKETANKGFLGLKNAVRVVRWTDKQKLESWNLIDEEGNNIVINQTMHQTAISKDYIILVDTSLKFSLDIVETDPFPNADWLNRLLRWFLAKTLEPTTPLYIVRRADLISGNRNVVAKKLIIGIETVHFATEYDNPDDIITMYAAHNSASCATEWVRPYDTIATNGQTVIENTIGMLTCGEMDISRAGKFRIDGKKGVFAYEKLVYQKGFEGHNTQDLTQAHTWAVGLMTHRHIFSARENPGTLPYIFWQNYGLDYRLLTSFIKDLYTNYQNRAIPVDDILNYYRQGVPFCLSRMNCETMEFDDWYNFKMNENLRSLQYINKKGSKTYTSMKEEALDGYILCTMVNGNADFSGDEYSREVWIFDAANLKKGPICKLNHPDMQFAFTIHSVWIHECKPSPADYHVNTIVDFLEVIENFDDKQKRDEMFDFLAETVFPNYPEDAL